MNAVTRSTHATTQTVTNVLVAGIVAALALLAVPSGAVVTASGSSVATIRFTVTAGASGSVVLSASPRKSIAHAATARFTPHVPPALPAVTVLVAASLALFGVVLLVTHRLRGVTAVRLPGVRGPPPRLASLAV
jgi:hypothetical protein